MKRAITATGLAALFAAGLAAQSTGTSASPQDPQTTTGGQRGGPRTVTGCLRAGDTAGTYLLINVEGIGGGRRGGDTTATTGSTSTGGGTTTGGTTTSGTTAAGGQGRGPGGPMSLMLAPDSSVDLKPHVGHQIEVTGTITGGRGGQGAAAGSTTTSATGTGTTTGGGTTTGSSSTTGTGATATGGQGRGGMRSMTVTNVKMVSESCS